jgi:hypothetical protein
MLNAPPTRLARRRILAAPLITRACLCMSIIASGLAVRGYGRDVGLPASVVKYGGSVLWGTMVFLLVTMAAPNRSRWRSALIAGSIAVGVELFRLVHTPWLDAFRLTIPGALLLGRIFSASNMLAYGVGIVLGISLDRFAIAAFANTRALQSGDHQSAS